MSWLYWICNCLLIRLAGNSISMNLDSYSCRRWIKLTTVTYLKYNSANIHIVKMNTSHLQNNGRRYSKNVFYEFSSPFLDISRTISDEMWGMAFWLFIHIHVAPFNRIRKEEHPHRVCVRSVENDITSSLFISFQKIRFYINLFSDSNFSYERQAGLG